MAPKAKKVEIGCLPKVISESERVPLMDISLADDSGWRALNMSKMQEKVHSFLKEGDFNRGVLGKVNLLKYDGQWVRASDGLIKIGDGRKTVAALKEIKVIWDDEAQRDAESWTAPLTDVMENGLDVSVLEFPQADHKLVLAHFAVAHEDATNTYQKTSVKDMAELANEFRKSLLGGRWEDVMKALIATTGKRMFAHRCVLVAQTVPSNVLIKIDEYQISSSWIYDNKYFVGQGAEATAKRITDQGRLACIENVHEDVLANRGVSANTFQQEYCATMKAAENWIAKQKKTYGRLCDQPFFERCVKFMQSNRARTQIYSCLRAGRKFENDAADAPGIEQCRAVVVELDKLKVLPKAEAGSAASPGHSLDPASAVAGAPGHGLDAASTPTNSMSAPVLEEEEPDPTKDAAMKKTDIALGKQQYYSSLQEMQRCLPAIVHPSHSVMVLVEAPTSKLRVVLEMLEQAKSVAEVLTTKQVCIAIPSGLRVDLLSAVANKAGLIWCVFF
jgi:hypothetical protein